MALQFNSFSANAMAAALRSGILSATNNQRLRVYGSNVAYPNAPINSVGNVPSGHLAEFANLTTTVSNGVITITGGNTTVATTGAGTVSWFAIYGQSGVGTVGGALISNSVSTTGGGGVLILNTLTPTSGQNLTIAFSLSLAAAT
jgi:hypothetical protein